MIPQSYTNAQMSFVENQHEFIEKLYDSASMGILVMDAQGNILSANPFIQNLFGYSSVELIGKKIETLIPYRFRDKHVDYREKFVKTPVNRPMGMGIDLIGLKKDGVEFPAEICLSHYHHDGQLFIVSFICDVSIRKQTESEKKQLKEVLEQKVEERTHQLREALEKLQSSKEEMARSLAKERDLNELKSRFVTMASHEFRTPLSTVLSSAYLLEKYVATEDQPKRKRHIERIISSVNMLTDILNDFLSVGKIEEGKIAVKPITFNINSHINGVISEMKNMQKKGQHISYLHTGEENVALDPSILKHIIMNLLSNAIKFSPEDSLIKIKSEVNAKQVILSIKDHGIGISAEDQRHLFERFHRGSNVTNIQGTGLGLHIVAKYTDLLNGKIKCKSVLEKGTEFIIKFDLL